MNILGIDLKVSEVPEPSNIVWENLSITGNTIFRNSVIVSVFIILFMFIALILFAYFKNLFA